MIEYSTYDLALGEVGSGIWSFLAFFLMVSFLRYAWRNRQSYREATVQGALALSLFFMGSTIRAGLGWGAAAAARRTTWPPEPWANSWPWYLPSLLISIIGAAWCLAVFTPPKRRVMMAILFLLSLTMPVVFSAFNVD